MSLVHPCVGIACAVGIYENILRLPVPYLTDHDIALLPVAVVFPCKEQTGISHGASQRAWSEKHAL